MFKAIPRESNIIQDDIGPCRDYGISELNGIILKSMNKSFNSTRARAIIFGSLLGDGSLKVHSGYKNARFSFKHSIKQKDYFLWKASKLSCYSSNNSKWIQDETEDNSSYGYKKVRFQSRALPELTKIWKITHRDNQKIINNGWLNNLNELSLAIWWLDDGSLIGNSRKGVFCTDSFKINEVKLLKEYLEKQWHIVTKIGVINKRVRLNIYSTKNLKKFLKIITPHIETKKMLYKTLLLYQDDKCQQNWISKINHYSIFSRPTIENIVRERKKKWKIFRK